MRNGSLTPLHHAEFKLGEHSTVGHRCRDELLSGRPRAAPANRSERYSWLILPRFLSDRCILACINVRVPSPLTLSCARPSALRVPSTAVEHALSWRCGRHMVMQHGDAVQFLLARLIALRLPLCVLFGDAQAPVRLSQSDPSCTADGETHNAVGRAYRGWMLRERAMMMSHHTIGSSGVANPDRQPWACSLHWSSLSAACVISA